MSHDELSTIVSPLGRDRPGPGDRAVPALTILWHHDLRCVGDVGAFGTRTTGVSRRTPPFDLNRDVTLSREPFLEIVPRGAGVELRPASGSASVEVSGQRLLGPVRIEPDALQAGVILTLGGAVVVCLHRLQIPRTRGPSLGLVGGSDGVEAIRRQIIQAAGTELPVLIRGETGTGKELVARALLTQSRRSARPFVAINMAAIPATTAADELFGHERGAFTGAADSRAGYFGEADGGTLFLDEIGAAPLEIQKMLLRVLETGEVRSLGGRRTRRVDVRILAATDEDLEAAVRAGRFSEPLLHRLAGYQIRLAPLRERREDVGPLFLYFLRQELSAIGEVERLGPRPASEQPWLRASDVARFARGQLTGNVRTVRNLARQLAISNRGRRAVELDAGVRALLEESAVPDRESLDSTTGPPTRPTDSEIQAALRCHNYNFSAAARSLGMHRSTLHDRIRENPGEVRSASSLSDEEILAALQRHRGDIVSMATDLHVSPKPLKSRLTTLRRVG